MSMVDCAKRTDVAGTRGLVRLLLVVAVSTSSNCWERMDVGGMVGLIVLLWHMAISTCSNGWYRYRTYVPVWTNTSICYDDGVFTFDGMMQCQNYAFSIYLFKSLNYQRTKHKSFSHSLLVESGRLASKYMGAPDVKEELLGLLCVPLLMRIMMVTRFPRA